MIVSNKAWRKRLADIALAGVFLLSSASCSSSPIDGAAKTGTGIEGLEENPSPKFKVKIHGRMPSAYDITLIAKYVTTSDAPECRRELPGFGGMAIERSTTTPLDTKREGNKYIAELVVDKVLPGECGWTFVSVASAISPMDDKSNPIYAERNLIDASRFDVDESVPRCAPRSPACKEDRYWVLSNANPTPVMALCGLSWRGGGNRKKIRCNDPITYIQYKKTHLLMRDTKSVEINFYDIDSEETPINLEFYREMEKKDDERWRRLNIKMDEIEKRHLEILNDR